jgi:hypothetical protein
MTRYRPRSIISLHLIEVQTFGLLLHKCHWTDSTVEYLASTIHEEAQEDGRRFLVDGFLRGVPHRVLDLFHR